MSDRRRTFRRRRILVGIGGVIVLAVLGVVGWYEAESHPFGAEGPGLVVRVTGNESTDSFIGALATHRVIGSSLAFRIGLLVHATPAVEPGAYWFHTNEPFSDVRATIAGGPDVFSLVIPPGMSLAEVEQRVASLPEGIASAFDQALHHDTTPSAVLRPATAAANLEGLLGVGTYQVIPGETGTQLLGQMTARFAHEVSAAGLSTAKNTTGLTPYQVVIVASIAVKEGEYEKYFGKVARVILNRLAAGTALQMTTTDLYAEGRDGGTSATVAAARSFPSPYNTYLHAGLPPTPICAVTAAALEAAESPPPGTWRYFVVVGKTGTTAFSDTYTELQANEKLAQQRGLG